MQTTTTRRKFLQVSAGALAGPLIVPAAVLGKEGAVPASERVTVGCIGVGGRGRANLESVAANPGAQVVAVCDVDATHRKDALRAAGLKADSGYGDFRELLGRRDIDAVVVSPPDHWHALITIAAAEAGKDIYCEKPLAFSIAEGRAVVEAVDKHKRILQCGTQRRSVAQWRQGCELVRNGRIGKLRKVEVGVQNQFAVRDGYTGLEAPEPTPQGFDYDMWLGPAPQAPYTPARCHFNFRWILDYSPGYITDTGAHYLDIAQWAQAADGSGPVAVEAQDVGSRPEGIYNAPESFRIRYTYANGVEVVMTATSDTSLWGVKFVGEKGSVSLRGNVNGSVLDVQPENLVTTRIASDEIHLYKSDDHHGNFIDCVKSRSPTAAPAEIGQRTATVCHLGTIAALLGRPLRWDPAEERFLGDDEANQMITRKMREPWGLQTL
jgi:predicted dehydrogenase